MKFRCTSSREMVDPKFSFEACARSSSAASESQEPSVAVAASFGMFILKTLDLQKPPILSWMRGNYLLAYSAFGPPKITGRRVALTVSRADSILRFRAGTRALRRTGSGDSGSLRKRR